MYRTIKQFFVLSLLAAVAMGCATRKNMTYLQAAGPEIADSINAKFQPQSETIIRSGDAITVYVSALDQEAVAPYNLSNVTLTKPGVAQVQTTPMLQYYIVDEAGDVELPVLGKVHVAGLKRIEAEEEIKKLLEAQVMKPLVHVNLVDAKVTVLGEVKNPGLVKMDRGRLTIFEALAAVGDLTPYGRRENVLQNDVLYVAPNGVRVVQSSNVGLWLSMVSTVASAATVIVTVVSMRNNSNAAPAK